MVLEYNWIYSMAYNWIYQLTFLMSSWTIFIAALLLMQSFLDKTPTFPCKIPLRFSTFVWGSIFQGKSYIWYGYVLLFHLWSIIFFHYDKLGSYYKHALSTTASTIYLSFILMHTGPFLSDIHQSPSSPKIQHFTFLFLNSFLSVNRLTFLERSCIFSWSVASSELGSCTKEISMQC